MICTLLVTHCLQFECLSLPGIHQYLSLLDDLDVFPSLRDSSGRVISLPPITNSNLTKISQETRDIFVEVTSGKKLQVAKTVADQIIQDSLLLLGRDEDTTPDLSTLAIEQVKVVDRQGNLKVVYPSKTDLLFSSTSVGGDVRVIRPVT